MSNFTPTEILNKIGALNKIEKVESLDREHVEFYLKQEYRYVPSKYKMFLMYNDEIYYFSSDDDFEDVALEILYAGFDFDGDVDIEDYYEVSYISQNPRTKAVCSPDPKYCAGLTKVYGTLYTERAKNLTQAIRSLYSQPFFKKYPPSLVSCYSYPEYFVSWNFDSFFERNKNTAAKMDEFLWRFYHTLRIDSKEDGYLFEPVNPYCPATRKKQRRRHVKIVCKVSANDMDQSERHGTVNKTTHYDIASCNSYTPNELRLFLQFPRIFSLLVFQKAEYKKKR